MCRRVINQLEPLQGFEPISNNLLCQTADTSPKATRHQSLRTIVMSGSVSTDKVVLNILIEGEDPRYDVFNVYIPRDITFGDLEDAIRATYEGKRYEPLGPLTLFKFNRPGEDYVGVTRKMMLDKLDKVDSASGWPAGSRIDDYMIHIVARIKGVYFEVLGESTVCLAMVS